MNPKAKKNIGPVIASLSMKNPLMRFIPPTLAPRSSSNDSSQIKPKIPTTSQLESPFLLGNVFLDRFGRLNRLTTNTAAFQIMKTMTGVSTSSA